MSKKTESARFTKVATDLALGVRDLVNWGYDTGNTTPEQMRLTIAARNEAAIEMMKAPGASLRKVAKLLGCSYQTVSNALTKDVKNIDTHTGSAVTKTRRAAVAAAAGAKGTTPPPSNKYRIIYADPPWVYGAHAQPDYQTEQRDHYDVMTVEAICAEPVRQWVENDAVLFLWATAPILEKSFAVVSAWGFEYKACFVWDKIKHNMGHYNSVRHELLLVCTRGACQPDVKQLFDSVQSIERGKHSEKPVEFFDIIETLYTHGRRLQMYGRKQRQGWHTFGRLAQLKAAE